MNPRIRILTRAPRMIPLLLAFLTAALTAGPAADPAPLKLPGIHNAFRVTPRILSGSQPEGDAAFAALARLGVKTIVSVDGAKPDVAAARKHGLRYVHLPIGYDGVPAERVAELAQASVTEPGGIYIHCHHGKHRGPAAVAVMCEATEGWTPARAEAWLKQAGTADDYPGLYRAVREFQPVTKERITRVGELPEVAETPALVEAMVAIEERFDALKSFQMAKWWIPPSVPNPMPEHAATLLREQLRELARTDDTAKRPGDFRKLLSASERAAATLLDTLRASPADRARLDGALKSLTQSCAACHQAYRNEKK